MSHSPRSRIPIAPASLLLAAHLAACARPAINLRPAAVASGDGAVFGRLRAVNAGKDVTQECSLQFADAGGGWLEKFDVDATGWFFLTLRRRPVALHRVVCTVIEGSGSGKAIFDAPNWVFVPGADRRIAYLGHLLVDLQYDATDLASAMLLGGTSGMARRTEEARARARGSVEDQFDAAVAEYRQRFGDAAGALQPERALLH